MQCKYFFIVPTVPGLLHWETNPGEIFCSVGPAKSRVDGEERAGCFA